MQEEARKGNIGIFDSGIGGVTVLREIIKILPYENYIYISDSKNNPYGDKKEEKIIERCEEIFRFLLEKNCKVVVIACNTASSIAVNYLRDKYKNIPIIAIEPAYKMVYDYSYDKETLVMATKGTIKSEKFNLLYEKYDNHKTILLECIGLADAIEEGNEYRIKKYLEKNLGEYKGKVENVVLGCTHYSLIKEEIKKILGENIRFFDGARRLAIHLEEVLEKNNLINDSKENGKIEFIDTAIEVEKREKNEKRFFKLLGGK